MKGFLPPPVTCIVHTTYYCSLKQDNISDVEGQNPCAGLKPWMKIAIGVGVVVVVIIALIVFFALGGSVEDLQCDEEAGDCYDDYY